MFSANKDKVNDEDLIERFLDDFMYNMYKGNDHIIARKYFRGLFHQLVPKYFCLEKQDETKMESTAH